MVLAVGESKAEIPLPPPEAFVNGQLKLPPRYYDLLATREQLVDRLYSYRIIENLPSEERAAVAVAITQ